MTILNQHESVIAAAREVLGDSFQEGVDVKTYITKAQRAEVIEKVTNSMAEGDTELSAKAREKFDTPQKLRTYVNGLVTNWFNKSKELNGGVAHETKNPGSRLGSSDATLKALKALKANLESEEAPADVITKVSDKIASRISELKVTKKPASFNAEDLPADIRDLVSL
jgi:hypothetical protein